MKKLIPLHETDLAPVHPGIMIERDLKVRGISENDFAAQTGIQIGTVQGIIAGTVHVEDDMIEKMKKFFGEEIDVIVESRNSSDYYRQHGHRKPPSPQP